MKQFIHDAGLRTLFLDLFAGTNCPGCAALMSHRHYLCDACCARVEGPIVISGERSLFQPALTIALGTYDSPLSDAIQQLKYRQGLGLIAPLARAMASAAREALNQTDRLTCAPVPAHPRRVVERGYHHAALLASAVAKALGCAYQPALLERRRHTEQQAKLDPAARRENVRGAMALGRGSRAVATAKTRVLLIDDVATTGCTAQACLDTLVAADLEIAGVLLVAAAGKALRVSPD